MIEPTIDGAVLMFSGGLDSLIGWYYLGQPQPMYAQIGHRYQTREEQVIARLETAVDGLHVWRTSRLYLGDYEYDDAYIPLRNLLLACVPLLNSTVKTVYIGAVKGEASRDKSKRFFWSTSRLLSYILGRKVRVSAPLKKKTKSQLVRWFVENHPDKIDHLKMTSSCYSKNPLPDGVQGCGMCNACFRRWVAMSSNGIEEKYLSPPVDYARETGMERPLMALRGVDPWELPEIIVNNMGALKQWIKDSR